MLNPQLITYIKSELAQGSSREAIRQNLIQGGGWTDAAINQHFSAVDSGTVIPQISVTDHTELKNRRNVFLVNFGLFILYTIISVLVGDVVIAMSVYIYHASILIILAIIIGIWGLVTKKKTYAGDLFLTAIALFIIGFGTCLELIYSGLIDFSI